jgi:mRNA interferase RelE/StbE
LAWTVEYSAGAIKALAKLDGPVRRRILDYMDSVGQAPDPRSKGKALTGTLAGFWRYRVGDWRVVCDLLDHRLVIVALRVDHRSKAH